MNREKLETIIEVLKTVPDDKFCIRHWMHNGCGCAIGHSAEAIGLEMEKYMAETYRPVTIKALMDCLDLDSEQICHLFLSFRYEQPTTKDMVINRIREFMK